jgi:hypothetical protein
VLPARETMQEPIVFEIHLTETSGWFGKSNVGWPHLFCWLRAFYFANWNDARIVLLAREADSWREYKGQPNRAELQAILDSLRELGLPGRELEVEGVVDSADVWTDLLLRVKVLDQSCELSLHMQASGFDGPDAEQLRALFRQIFALAGYEPYHRPVYE